MRRWHCTDAAGYAQKSGSIGRQRRRRRSGFLALADNELAERETRPLLAIPFCTYIPGAQRHPFSI